VRTRVVADAQGGGNYDNQKNQDDDPNAFHDTGAAILPIQPAHLRTKSTGPARSHAGWDCPMCNNASRGFARVTYCPSFAQVPVLLPQRA
jgi:hypothetical protein